LWPYSAWKVALHAGTILSAATNQSDDFDFVAWLQYAARMQFSRNHITIAFHCAVAIFYFQIDEQLRDGPCLGDRASFSVQMNFYGDHFLRGLLRRFAFNAGRSQGSCSNEKLVKLFAGMHRGDFGGNPGRSTGSPIRTE
jgi:hypothetical protein